MQVLGTITDVFVPIPSNGCRHSLPFKNILQPFSDSKFPFLSYSGNFNKSSSSFYIGKLAIGINENKSKKFLMRASYHYREDSPPIAPVLLETEVGKMLIQILEKHQDRDRFPVAMEHQLQNLKNDRDAQEEVLKLPTATFLDRRIFEVREMDRRQILEDILYCAIVHKFTEKSIYMIAKLKPSSYYSARVDYWPNQIRILGSVHSSEAFELIQSHLFHVIGDKHVGPLYNVVPMSKIELGKLYAASIMYGYFLRRVDQRYQLEKTMRTLAEDNVNKTVTTRGKSSQSQIIPFWDPPPVTKIPVNEIPRLGEPFMVVNGKSNKLKSYVKNFDDETLHRYANVRSREAMSLIERQTQAVFGRPDIKIVDGDAITSEEDEAVMITFSGLIMLLLEAVAFGSFLWDSEDYVDSKYRFIDY